MKITDYKNWQQIKKVIPLPLFEFFLWSYYNLRSIKYSGNNVFCPVCETKFNNFVNNSCPKCCSGIRHRTFWIFLQRKTNFFSEELKVIHFAPEYCFKKMKKLKNIDYLSADFNSPRAMQKIDMMGIPYPENHFDVTISIDVLDDVPDDFKAISELYRVQKTGGWSIHLSPIDESKETTLEDSKITSDPEKRLKFYGAYANLRRYGRDYKDRFVSKGFKVEVFNTKDFCSDEEIENMGLQNDFEIFYLKK